MADTKTFATLAVASAATGVALGEGFNYSLMQEIWDQVLGRPVWTHELADRALAADVHSRLLAAFPGLPTTDEAHADWRAAAAKASAAYGPTLDVPRGDSVRTEGPVESLARLTGRPDDIIVVHAPD